MKGSDPVDLAVLSRVFVCAAERSGVDMETLRFGMNGPQAVNLWRKAAIFVAWSLGLRMTEIAGWMNRSPASVAESRRQVDHALRYRDPLDPYRVTHREPVDAIFGCVGPLDPFASSSPSNESTSQP